MDQKELIQLLHRKQLPIEAIEENIVIKWNIKVGDITPYTGLKIIQSQ